jgi:DNA polymerase-3 subunit delta
MPFLSPYRLIIVDGLLGKFEPKKEKQQSAGTGTARSGKRQKEWQNLEQIIREIPQSTVLILVDAEIKGKNSMLKKLEPLLKELKSTAVVKVFPLLKGRYLKEWVQKRASEESANISDGAVTLLIELIGSNLWSMSNEILKLALYVQGRAINEKDVADLADYSRESNIFLLVDAIVEGKSKVAQKMLYRMYQSGSSPSYILSMITRQFRLIAQALELDPDLSVWQMQTKLGVSGYPLEKTLKQAKSYNLSQVGRAYTELIQTDMAIKSGKYLDNQLALEFMILSIGRAG